MQEGIELDGWAIFGMARRHQGFVDRDPGRQQVQRLDLPLSETGVNISDKPPFDEPTNKRYEPGEGK